MVGECDICGTDAISNVSIQLETNQYHDGPPRAKLPRMTFCHDCADEVSKYLNERAGKLEEEEQEESPFSESDAAEYLSMLKHNENLVLEIPPLGYGYRYQDGEFKLAHTPLPSPPATRPIEPSELKERITTSSRVILKRLDEEAWERYE
jgi:hypothetical protein